MNLKIQNILGLEKLHPEIQSYLDKSNLIVALPASIVVMLLEAFAFTTTFFYTFKEGQDPAQWLFFHRSLYIGLFTAAAQLFAYSIYHIIKKIESSRIILDISIFIFIGALLFFGVAISLSDYLSHEQILVFLSIELFVVCVFMIKPYIAVLLVIVPSAILFCMMEKAAGVSTATLINYPIIVFLFVIVNVVRYLQYLSIANKNVINLELADQLRNASRYDFLTKLKNRTALNMDFENPENKQLNSNFIIMLTDIDDFKVFNDKNGHHYGDELLKKFAAILQEAFGKKHCYRYGGDEYLIVLPEIKKDDFLQKIKTCEENINAHFHFSGGYTRGFVSSSRDLHHLINQADENLYEAKGAGKNKVIGSF